ncbi:MAG: hypothetical protein QME77_07075 [bacterium]|nr:hypothetical protein [bacterium]
MRRRVCLWAARRLWRHPVVAARIWVLMWAPRHGLSVAGRRKLHAVETIEEGAP